MGFGARLRAGAVAAGIVVLIAGCTSSTADGPTTTRLVTITGTPSAIDPSPLMPGTIAPPSGPSPSVAETSPPASPDPAAQEAADRAAIEAQWIIFWRVYRDMVGAPADERLELVSSVAKSPLKENLLDIASDANADGIENYGEITHHIFWELPVDGQNVASIADCQDQSQAGTFDIATGLKSPSGGSRVNIRGQLVRDSSGIWLVQTLVDMGVDNC